LTLFEDLIRNYARKDQNAIKELYTAFSKDNTRINTVNNPYDLYSVYLAEKFNAGAYQKSILTACVSSTQAIALASDSIRNGECEVVITGGTDSLVNLLALISFGKLGIIPESDGEKSCFPFDTKRKGTLAGEAAGIVIMASEDFVKRNELKPVAQFMGYGNTLDGYKITAPDPEGTAMVQAIKDAVNNAGITTDQIDYINAHGTGTRHNDHLELQCLERALGKEVNTIPISSTKDRHGHAIAAAGVQELCLLLELMKNSTIPKNLQMTSPCDTSFNLVNENYAAPIKYALTNNFAFGGINTVLTIKNELL
jgi:3-oxoacyl-[acyl-carrier-protein] synthase II